MHDGAWVVQGECGKRGGWMELTGFPSKLRNELQKLCAIHLCPNVIGQITCALMAQPPLPSDPSFALFQEEVSSICASLKRKAINIHRALSQLPGITCAPPEAALYLFPRVAMPQAAIDDAAAQGCAADMLYCKAALDATGIVLVPGSGFQQRPGTHHFRITILPREDEIDGLCARLHQFHTSFMAKYSTPAHGAGSMNSVQPTDARGSDKPKAKSNVVLVSQLA